MKYLKNASILIQEDDQIIGYFLDEGYELCIRTMETSESYINFANEEELIDRAVDLLNEGAELLDGELPGYNRCSFCEDWTNHGQRCEVCEDYVYRHS